MFEQRKRGKRSSSVSRRRGGRRGNTFRIAFESDSESVEMKVKVQESQEALVVGLRGVRGHLLLGAGEAGEEEKHEQLNINL